MHTQSVESYSSLEILKQSRKKNLEFFKKRKFNQITTPNLFGEDLKNLYIHPRDLENIHDPKLYKTSDHYYILWNFLPKTLHLYSMFYSDVESESETWLSFSSNLIYLKSFQYTQLSFYDDDDIGFSSILPINEVENNDLNEITSTYTHLRKIAFIDFFTNFSVDVPICFKKSPSLKSINDRVPLLKFSNFLMRSGQKETSFRNLFLVLRFLINKSIKEFNHPQLADFNNWKDFYFLLSNFFYLKSNAVTVFNEFDYLVKSNENEDILTSLTSLHLSTGTFIKNFLIKLLSQISPVFSYFIYSVDKNVRKFSRGKSGKYTFIWKYIPFYKRIRLSMRWIAKDIKFDQNKKFFDRISNVLLTLKSTPHKSFAWKSKIFAHNYVFKNFRSTLMSTLKTTHQ